MLPNQGFQIHVEDIIFPDEMKECSLCKIPKPLFKNFRLLSTGRFHARCRTCESKVNVKYILRKRKIDPEFRRREQIKSGILSRIRNYSNKYDKYFEDHIGCTIKEYIEHIESLQEPGMTWDNHGQGPDTWQIHHIIPISEGGTFHYTNVQPLWYENHRKVHFGS